MISVLWPIVSAAVVAANQAPRTWKARRTCHLPDRSDADLLHLSPVHLRDDATMAPSDGVRPGGRGARAADVFQEAAERYGWIVAASENSRNGPWEPTLARRQRDVAGTSWADTPSTSGGFTRRGTPAAPLSRGWSRSRRSDRRRDRDPVNPTPGRRAERPLVRVVRDRRASGLQLHRGESDRRQARQSSHPASHGDLRRSGTSGPPPTSLFARSDGWSSWR